MVSSWKGGVPVAVTKKIEALRHLLLFGGQLLQSFRLSRMTFRGSASAHRELRADVSFDGSLRDSQIRRRIRVSPRFNMPFFFGPLLRTDLI